MTRLCRRFLAALTPAALTASPALAQPAKDAVDFNRDVRPILSGKCFLCHGPDDKARKAGLRLDLRSAATRETAKGNLPIVPGRPDDSELLARVSSPDD